MCGGWGGGRGQQGFLQNMRHETNIINYFLFGGWGWGWVGPYGFMEKMGDDTNMNIYVFGGGGVDPDALLQKYART